MPKVIKPEKPTPNITAAQSPVDEQQEENKKNGNGNGRVDPFAEVQMLHGSGPFAGMSVGFAILDGDTADKFPYETPYQRKPSKRTYTKYARVQTEGKWIKEYPSTFIMDKDGNILDGGHRKLAVGLSRVGIPIVLLKGVTHKAVHAIDRPKPRSLAANLAWDSKVAPHILAQMLRFYKSWHVSGTFKDFAGYDVQDYYEVLSAHSDMEVTAPRWTLKASLPKVQIGLFAIVEYLIGQEAGEDAHDFLMDCARGEALTIGDPAYAFRDWVVNLGPKRTIGVVARIGYALIYCWDKYRRGLSMKNWRAPAGCPDIEPLS